MNEKKISTNIFYNIINQVVTFVTPLVLSPYVSRVLSAELVGDYSFALANSSYFVLIEALGLSLYGMLKVSSTRNDKKEISALFKEIMVAKTILMGICIVFYLSLFVFIDGSNQTLNLIMILNIISTGIDSTWFLCGVEDFKTTTIRNAGVRIINVVLVFVFVKSRADFLIYALIMQGSNVLSYIVVFPAIKKYIIPVSVSLKRVFIHIKNSMVYFIPGIINTIFTSADKTILGAFSNNYEVGVYEQASKICSMCGSIINSVSNVMLPRITYLNHHNNKEESKKILFKTIRCASIISIGISAGMICVSDYFVPFFFGPGYDKSTVLLQILSINVLLNVVANYMGQQCLVSNNKQGKYNIAISIAAVTNVVLNLILVNEYQSIGVSIASVVSSLITLVFVLYFSKEKIKFNDLIKMTWKSIFSAFVMVYVLSFIKLRSISFTLIVRIPVGALIYFIMLFLLREQMIREIIFELKSFVQKKAER